MSVVQVICMPIPNNTMNQKTTLNISTVNAFSMFVMTKVTHLQFAQWTGEQ